jgi:hypothetical protein
MQPTIPNTRDFEIMLNIVPIRITAFMYISSSNNLTILLNCQVLIFVTLVT